MWNMCSLFPQLILLLLISLWALVVMHGVNSTKVRMLRQDISRLRRHYITPAKKESWPYRMTPSSNNGLFKDRGRESTFFLCNYLGTSKAKDVWTWILAQVNIKGQSPVLAKTLMSESVSQLLYSSDNCELQFRLRLWMRRRRCPLMVVYSKAHWETGAQTKVRTSLLTNRKQIKYFFFFFLIDKRHIPAWVPPSPRWACRHAWALLSRPCRNPQLPSLYLWCCSCGWHQRSLWLWSLRADKHKDVNYWEVSPCGMRVILGKCCTVPYLCWYGHAWWHRSQCSSARLSSGLSGNAPHRSPPDNIHTYIWVSSTYCMCISFNQQMAVLSQFGPMAMTSRLGLINVP